MTIAAFIGEIIIGWLLADLVTGVFHWWEDNFGSEDWLFVGRWLIAPNRLHHVDALAFTRHGFWNRNGASIAAALAAGGILAWIFGPAPWIASLALGAAFSNEVHRFAHQPSIAPGWLRVLQEIGIAQSPKAHAGHHRPPHDVNFCVLTDWLNPLLEATGFWRGLGCAFGRA